MRAMSHSTTHPIAQHHAPSQCSVRPEPDWDLAVREGRRLVLKFYGMIFQKSSLGFSSSSEGPYTKYEWEKGGGLRVQTAPTPMIYRVQLCVIANQMTCNYCRIVCYDGERHQLYPFFKHHKSKYDTSLLQNTVDIDLLLYQDANNGSSRPIQVNRECRT